MSLDFTPDKPLAKSYALHRDKCFFISTINRDSSAMDGPSRYAETMVWEYNYETSERGKMVFMDDGSEGSIRTHIKTLQQFCEHGKPPKED